MTEVYKKCDDCKNWPLGCELDGDFRRSCIKDNYDCYDPKKMMRRYLCLTCEKWKDWMDMHDEKLCKNCWRREQYLKRSKTAKTAWGRRRE